MTAPRPASGDAARAPLRFDARTHTYWCGECEVPSVSEVIAPLRDLSAIPQQVLARKAALGTAVHLACELIDEGVLHPRDVTGDAAPYVAGWIKFRRDTGFAPELIEQRLFNSDLWYAGTLDRVGVINGQRAVVEIKTTAVLHDVVGVQLAAYRQALLVQCGIETTARWAVQLRPDGSYRMRLYAEPLDWPAFVSLLTLTAWRSPAVKDAVEMPDAVEQAASDAVTSALRGPARRAAPARFTAEVVDMAAFVAHVAAHPHLAECVSPNARALAQLASAQREALCLPGVRLTPRAFAARRAKECAPQ